MNKDEKDLNVLFAEDTDWMTEALDELLTMNDDMKDSDFADTDPDILSMVTRTNSSSEMRGQCRSQLMTKLLVILSILV